jgi:hypothetical protein
MKQKLTASATHLLNTWTNAGNHIETYFRILHILTLRPAEMYW